MALVEVKGSITDILRDFVTLIEYI